MTEQADGVEGERVATAGAWDLLIARDDPAVCRVVEVPEPVAQPGEVVLKVDLLGVTTNTVAYASLGEELRYWEFFPAEPGWGKVPIWGFADVVASEVPGIEVGTRVYGFLPGASHLTVTPEMVGGSRFRDVGGRRPELPPSYNNYLITREDAAYHPADREDLQVLFRPLFITSFALEDWLHDRSYFEADTVVMSSASSKTAYGTAYLAQRRQQRARLVGLTSEANKDFTASLGCYDEVLTYGDIESLPADTPTLYVDVAGSSAVRASVHGHFSDRLVYDAIVGLTHGEGVTPAPADQLLRPQPTFWFAPEQLRKRGKDWGPGGVASRFGAAWREFVPVVRDWVSVEKGHGASALREVWTEMVAGRSHPRVGHVLKL